MSEAEIDDLVVWSGARFELHERQEQSALRRGFVEGKSYEAALAELSPLAAGGN